MNKERKPGARALALAVLVLVFLLGLYLRLEGLDAAIVNDWTARDFDRAFNIVDGDYIPLAGPEVNNGGRLPGPFMYFLLSIPILFHYSYESIFNFNFILNLASIGGLFFILKKYFNIYFSVLSTALLSVNLSHIEAVLFPINPSFLFPFTVLFLWCYLEFSLRKNENSLPWAMLVVLLAVQFHYSIAAYFLIPVVTALFFKIEISIKTCKKILAIGVICLLPYIIYTLRVFSPSNDGLDITLIKTQVDSVLDFIKLLTVQNTISYLASSNCLCIGPVRLKSLEYIDYASTSLALYSLFIITVYKSRKQGIEACKKEIALLAFFMVPAMTYELIGAARGHYWYSFSLRLPQILIFSAFVASLLELTKVRFVRVGLISSAMVFVIFSAYQTYNYSKKAIKRIEIGILNPNHMGTGTYKSSKDIARVLLEKLELTPEQFFERVYLLDFRIASFRRLKFADGQTNSEFNDKNEKRDNCFFIINAFDKREQVRELQYQSFLKDPTLIQQKIRKVQFKSSGLTRGFWVYEYVPRFNQSCYSNSFNPFVVKKSIRDLLVEAKGLSEKGGPVNFKTLSVNKKFDSKSKLVFFQGHYIIFNHGTQTPFRLRLNIKRESESYFLRGEIESYYFWGQPDLNLSKLDIFIIPTSSYSSFFHVIQPEESSQENLSFNILSENVLASSLNNLQNPNYLSYKQNWFRELAFPKEFVIGKNRFDIVVSWKMHWDNSSRWSGSIFEQNNYLRLAEKI